MANPKTVIVNTKLTTEKYCILPGQKLIRCASKDGHTIIIGEIPRTIPMWAKSDALRQNALTESALQNWLAGVGRDPEPEPEIELPAAPEQVAGINAGQRFVIIKERLLPILVAGNPKDFTQQGIPQVASLTAACGFDVTAAERDAAFSELKDSEELAKALEKTK